MGIDRMFEEGLDEACDLGGSFTLAGKSLKQTRLFLIRYCGVQQKCGGDLHLARRELLSGFQMVNQGVHARSLSRGCMDCQQEASVSDRHR